MKGIFSEYAKNSLFILSGEENKRIVRITNDMKLYINILFNSEYQPKHFGRKDRKRGEERKRERERDNIINMIVRINNDMKLYINILFNSEYQQKHFGRKYRKRGEERKRERKRQYIKYDSQN